MEESNRRKEENRDSVMQMSSCACLESADFTACTKQVLEFCGCDRYVLCTFKI